MNQGRKKTGQSETVALFVPEKEVDFLEVKMNKEIRDYQESMFL